MKRLLCLPSVHPVVAPASAATQGEMKSKEDRRGGVWRGEKRGRTWVRGPNVDGVMERRKVTQRADDGKR